MLMLENRGEVENKNDDKSNNKSGNGIDFSKRTKIDFTKAFGKFQIRHQQLVEGPILDYFKPISEAPKQITMTIAVRVSKIWQWEDGNHLPQLRDAIFGCWEHNLKIGNIVYHVGSGSDSGWLTKYAETMSKTKDAFTGNTVCRLKRSHLWLPSHQNAPLRIRELNEYREDTLSIPSYTNHHPVLAPNDVRSIYTNLGIAEKGGRSTKKKVTITQKQIALPFVIKEHILGQSTREIAKALKSYSKEHLKKEIDASHMTMSRWINDFFWGKRYE